MTQKLTEVHNGLVAKTMRKVVVLLSLFLVIDNFETAGHSECTVQIIVEIIQLTSK